MTVEVPVTTATTTSIFGRGRFRDVREERRRKMIDDMIKGKENTVSYLWDSKVRESHEPDFAETRVLPRCCRNCLLACEFQVWEEIKHYGLMNCLKDWKLNPKETLSSHKLPTLKELENDPDLLSLYPPKIRESSVPEVQKNVKKEVLEVLNKFLVTSLPAEGFFVAAGIRIFAWFCRKYLACFFKEVLVHEGHMHMLRDLHTQQIPIIYFPIYRSSFDKALLFWTLAANGIQIPLFIPDDKDNRILSKYLGGMGTYLKVTSNDIDDDLKYSSAVATYFRGLMRKRNNNNSIMLNLEVTKSRTGRPSTRVYGSEFLRIIYDDFISGKLEDAYFVPVSVSYEVLPDPVETSQTRTRRRPTFLSWIIQIVTDFFRSGTPKGFARVNFSQPIKLREFVKSLNKNPKVLAITDGYNDSYCRTKDCSFLRWDSNDSLSSVSPIYGTLAQLYPAEEEKRLDCTILDVMSYHLIHDAGKCESIMPTHLLAFLVMKKFRNGGTLEEFKIEMDSLIERVKEMKKDFGFYIGNCNAESIIARGCKLLRDDLDIQLAPKTETYTIKPKNVHESLLRLEYYANYLVPEFAMEAVISVALFATSESRLSIYRGLNAEIELKDDLLMDHCKRVYETFDATFLLHPPCLTSEGAIRTCISRMSDTGLISLKMAPQRRYYSDDDDDYSDDYYNSNSPTKPTPRISSQEVPFIPEAVKVITTKENVDELDFHRKLLLPYFEIFAFLASSLKILLTLKGERKEMRKEKLEKYLFEELLKQMEGEFSKFGEFISLETVKNFLSTCEDHEVIYLGCDRNSGNQNMRFYGLETKYSKDGGIELDNLADNILFYATI